VSRWEGVGLILCGGDDVWVLWVGGKGKVRGVGALDSLGSRICWVVWVCFFNWFVSRGSWFFGFGCVWELR